MKQFVSIKKKNGSNPYKIKNNFSYSSFSGNLFKTSGLTKFKGLYPDNTRTTSCPHLTGKSLIALSE